jgi:hypothetical protein
LRAGEGGVVEVVPTEERPWTPLRNPADQSEVSPSKMRPCRGGANDKGEVNNRR